MSNIDKRRIWWPGPITQADIAAAASQSGSNASNATNQQGQTTIVSPYPVG